MNAGKRTCALTLALGALGAGCGSDGGNNDGYVDAAASVADASVSEAGTEPAFACTSYTPPKLPALCGGSHCQESPEKLRADTPPTAKCGTSDEVTAFCSLKAVNVVGDCVVAAFGDPAGTRTCATPMLPELSAGCLDCFLGSAQCAAEKCLNQCLSRETKACDDCRVREGCISSFYQCAGFVNPLPANWQ